MGTRDGYPFGTFCWVDLATTDAVAAKRFYADLLGWEAPGGAAYTHYSIGGRDVAAVYERDGVAPHWSSYVAVDDADAVAARATELGATVVEPPFDVAEGRRAVVADPVGAPFALWQAGTHPGAELVNDVGCLCSNQLQAPDPGPAVPFYRDLLGWEVEPEGDSYWSVRNAGADNGGCSRRRGRPDGSSTSMSPRPTRRPAPPRARARPCSCRRRRSASAGSRSSPTRRARRSACSRARPTRDTRRPERVGVGLFGRLARTRASAQRPN